MSSIRIGGAFSPVGAEAIYDVRYLQISNNLSDVNNVATSRTNLGLGTGDSPQFTAIELGHATDTTLARVSAGVVSIEGSEIVTENSATVAFQQATTISTTAGDLTLNPAANVLIGNTKNLLPATSDGSQLGSGTLMWSDLFLASGAVINFNNGNVTITHSAGTLTLNDTVLDVGLSGAFRFGSANNAITQSGGTVTFTAGGVSRLTMRGTDGFVEVLFRTQGSLTAELRHFLINTRNLTFNEATALATFRKVHIAQDTLVGSGAGVGETITDAATFYIAGAPVASGDMTIANPYALWVDAGISRFDGNIYVENRLAWNTNPLNYFLSFGATMTFAVGGGVTRLALSGDTDPYVDVSSRNMVNVGPLTAEIRHFVVSSRSNVTVADGVTIPTFRKVHIAQDTYIGVAGGGTETITDAATFYIAGAPINGGNLTLSNPYALWVDAGAVRLDTSAANGTVATVLGSLGPTGSNTTVQEWLPININGTVRYLPCF